MKTRHSLWVMVLLVLLHGCGSTASQGPPTPGPTTHPSPELSACPEPAPPLSRTSAPPSLVVQNGHTQGITGVKLDESGRILASASTDGTVRVWDTHTGLMLRRIATKGRVIDLSLSSRGDRLAYRSHDGSTVKVMVVDLAAGSAPRSLGSDGALAVSPDGQHVVVGLHRLRLYDAGTGDELKELALSPIRALAFDPDGHQLALAFGDELALIEVPSLKVIRRWPHPSYRDVRDTVTGLVLLGDRLILRTGWVTYLMGTKPGDPVHTIGRPALDVAAQGDRVLLAEMAGPLSLWSLSSGKELPATPYGGRVHRLAVAAGGSTIALSSSDGRNHVIRVVRGSDLRPIRTLEGRTTGVTALAFRPDGTELVTGSAIADLTRWDLRTGELLGVTGGEEANPIRSVTFDPSGSLVAATAGTWWVRVRDGTTGKLVRQWPAHKQKRVVFTSFLPRGKELLTVADTGGMRRWDLSPPPIPPPKRFHRFVEVARPTGGAIGAVGWPVERAALSPDGAWLAVLGDDHLMQPSGARVVPVMGGRIGMVSTSDAAVRWEAQVITGVGSRDRRLAFSADGSTLLHAASEPPGGGRRLARPVPVLTAYDAVTGQVQRRVHPGTAGTLAALDSVIAIGGRHPALLQWPSLAVRQRITTHDFESTVAAHRPSKRFAFVGEGGATVIVTAAGKTLAMLAATTTGEYVTATPNGAFLASLDGARNVAWTFPGPLEGFSFEQFAARFDRPDLVAQTLATGTSVDLGTLSRPPRVTLDLRHWKRDVSKRTVPLKATVAS
ncbi:MAG: hypothetical protein DRI90_24295, partial [Deltaproteobacteria bacterium]